MFRPAHSTGREASDEQLMQQCCKGERRAFELLYERYFDKLTWFAMRFLNDGQKAEDAVQEVFIRIIERPEQFDEGKKFSTWVYTVTANACKNILRNEQNRLRLLAQHIAPHQNRQEEMQHDTDYRLLQERLKTGFAALSEKEKSIYILRFEQELSIREIAEVHGIPEGSVKSGIYYLLKKMAGHLKEFAHGR